ncbi:hypothetical protein Q2K19_15615 [Micromonospora soli]|uniref:hypothetical protein n=1 Tax=Micromonospora sp. NBRC 110009 TaxID=3061627 RepID=UPI002671CB1B|nr:hypothetical protein [Micromonospora sp. NBRC 110009]WKU01797.1 hypothetical protein Q2K19_15615 [Micromonospora sp. NBRC 110009]
MLLSPTALALDWQEASDQATVIGVLVALAVGIATTVVMIRQEKVTRDGQRLQATEARAAAERSESAARLTEEYTRRVVEALETMAANSTGNAEAGPIAPRVQWSLEHHQNDAYRLTNVGDEVAENVRITAHESMFLKAPEHAMVAPDEAIIFIAARSMATSDSTITIRWFGGDSGREEQTWKYPLPARPRR